MLVVHSKVHFCLDLAHISTPAKLVARFYVWYTQKINQKVFCIVIAVIIKNLICQTVLSTIAQHNDHRRKPDSSSSDASLTDYMPTCFCLRRNVKVWRDLHSKTNLQHTPLKQKLRAEGTSLSFCSKMLYKITFRG